LWYHGDGIVLAHGLPHMAKAGLSALADSYGLERGAAEEIRRRGERFFELLGESFEPLVARRIKLRGLRQSVESFADFCAATNAQHTLLLGAANQPALSFRLDHPLALGLVEGVLGQYRGAGGEEEAPLTMTERRILVNLLRGAVTAAVPPVFQDLLDNQFGGSVQLQIIAARDEAGLITEMIDAVEPIAVSSAEYVINGRSGVIALGLSAATLAKVIQPSEVARANAGGSPREPRGQSLAAARFPLTAVLGSVTMPLTAVRALTPGSVIPLGQMRAVAPLVELRSGRQVLGAGTVIAERGWYRFLMQSRPASGPS
jgi:flagellar motor switch/type III secretory pathway protein FliN